MVGLKVSGGHELRSGLAGWSWFGVSQEAVDTMLTAAESTGGLTGQVDPLPKWLIPMGPSQAQPGACSGVGGGSQFPPTRDSPQAPSS